MIITQSVAYTTTTTVSLIELENQVQWLMVAHLAPTQPNQVNKITTSCGICSGPHDTQYCMEDPKQAFVEYASSRTDEAGEGLVSNFMAFQDARLSKFEANFKQQQSEMSNKIDTVLKVITDRITGAVPSDMVKNLKLSTSPVLSARSYLNIDPRCSNHIHGSINAITIYFEKQSNSHDEKTEENDEEEKVSPKKIDVNSSPPPNPAVSFITKKIDVNSFLESLGLVPNRLVPNLFATKGMTTTENSNKGVSNFTGMINEMHVFVGNFIVDFMIAKDISSIINPRLSQVVIGKPFVEISNMTQDPPEGVVRFINRTDKVSYKMPYNIKRYKSLSDLEEEYTKSVYLRNEEDKKRGVKYAMSKILEFYNECLELDLNMLLEWTMKEKSRYIDKKELGSYYEVSFDDSWRTI
nr:retrotransposon Orf1 [Tanacetum cinerariifolium]